MDREFAPFALHNVDSEQTLYSSKHSRACPPTPIRPRCVEFLRRFGPRGIPRLRRLHDYFLARMCQRPRALRRALLDLDSTVLTLYGHQEQARIGYNPRKRGRASYHPLVCFEGQTKDCWHAEPRPSDVHARIGTVWLLRACFAKLPAAECLYHPHGWPQPYRFVVARKTLPEEESPQTTLFTIGRYSYHAFVTNFRLRPHAVYRFYNARAVVELIIKELKADYPLAKIPTSQFAANEVYFHLLLLAYNLVNWFKRLCLPRQYHATTLGTLRSRLLLIPGEFVHTRQGPTLRLPSSPSEQEAIKQALTHIARLKI